MNDSVLILADFDYPEKIIVQNIDSELFDFNALWALVKKNPAPLNYLIRVDDPKSYFKELLSKQPLIKAAGGLVRNGRGDFLFIYRLGKWDLPKGKLEEGEKMRETAVREVEEECGIAVDYLGPKIISGYHVYEIKGKMVVKKTNWYEMAVNKVPKLKPQLSEDITKARWIPAEGIGSVMTDTYPLIKDIVNVYQRRA
ncbi:NUDIX hydrolase [Olivibacter sitiensis]|uniref:NUDIX hydrolase n=1 Tax=Olivibacter sitiensis TaxID=376470 RepID=UPI0004181D43|nr:NUDIX domain-containing protein [Olivibacter sitiensis]